MEVELPVFCTDSPARPARRHRARGPGRPVRVLLLAGAGGGRTPGVGGGLRRRPARAGSRGQPAAHRRHGPARRRRRGGARATLAEPEAVHWLREAVLRYSRELAFAAAQVYAAAAEVRGAWDARLEALVIDSLVRGTDGGTVAARGSVLARAAALGWRSTERVVAMAGRAPAGDPEPSLVALHRVARIVGADLLAGVQARRSSASSGADDPLAAARRSAGLLRRRARSWSGRWCSGWRQATGRPRRRSAGCGWRRLAGGAAAGLGAGAAR